MKLKNSLNSHGNRRKQLYKYNKSWFQKARQTKYRIKRPRSNLPDK